MNVLRSSDHVLCDSIASHVLDTTTVGTTLSFVGQRRAHALTASEM